MRLLIQGYVRGDLSFAGRQGPQAATPQQETTGRIDRVWVSTVSTPILGVHQNATVTINSTRRAGWVRRRSTFRLSAFDTTFTYVRENWLLRL